MKTPKLHFKGALLLVVLLSALFTIAQCIESTNLHEDILPCNEGCDSLAVSQQLTAEEIDAILFMREEEKLARDVYLFLYEVHPLRPFLNISKSEQAHMDAMLYLIDTYGLEDPVGDNPEGKFENAELQQLYSDLIERGSKSREEALAVGALIEEVDIIDLRNAMDESVKNEDVIRVFENLCKASENHLRAFVRVLGMYNVDYQPELLEKAEFDRILAE